VIKDPRTDGTSTHGHSTRGLSHGSTHDSIRSLTRGSTHDLTRGWSPGWSRGWNRGSIRRSCGFRYYSSNHQGQYAVRAVPIVGSGVSYITPLLFVSLLCLLLRCRTPVLQRLPHTRAANFLHQHVESLASFYPNIATGTQGTRCIPHSSTGGWQGRKSTTSDAAVLLLRKSVRHSPVVIVPFVAPHSALVPRPSSFLIPHSSFFILHPSFFKKASSEIVTLFWPLASVCGSAWQRRSVGSFDSRKSSQESVL
jgi:hypothetical protein